MSATASIVISCVVFQLFCVKIKLVGWTFILVLSEDNILILTSLCGALVRRVLTVSLVFSSISKLLLLLT